ncbi:hypothetical protein AYO45_06635 [Gammaproteobacteria bacterium SCGC AG-212-F23]|nr:hypothetical protein AYO45_06635 [Gammaproteobacteria bacterium SCGC AG-212-F23]
MFNVKEEVLSAENRIRNYIRETPLDCSIVLSQLTGAQVYLKHENMQYTNSFKVRGALNKLLSLTAEQRANGIVTASSGNHGAAVAYGLHQFNIPGIIFVPENASSAKVKNIRNYGAQLEFYATDCMQTEIYAREYANTHHKTYISPYNDLQVLGGQGTIAIELMKQLEKVDVIFVPVGGGGLISGIAGYVKAVSPTTKIIGCLPETSPALSASIAAGKIIEIETLPTLSDATAGNMELGSITFEISQKYVDDYVLVSEEEIKNAIIFSLKSQHCLIEGAAAVALAALLKTSSQWAGKNAVVILSGSNISFDTLKKIICE